MSNNSVVRTQRHLSDQFKSALFKKREDLINVLPKNVSVDKFINVVMMAVNDNPALLKCDIKSFFIACMRSAQDGLYPDGREAALVVYKDTVTYMSMVLGVLKKIKKKVDMVSGTPHMVYENDYFKRTLGDEEKIEHIPSIGNRGKPIGVYVIVKTSYGERYAEFISHDELMKIRAASKRQSIWDQWFSEYAKKSVLRRVEKRIPGKDDSDPITYAEDEDDKVFSTIEEDIEPPIPPNIENKTGEPPQNVGIDSIKKEITYAIGNMGMLENIWGYKVEPLLEEMNDDEKEDISSFYDDAINKTKMGG